MSEGKDKRGAGEAYQTLRGLERQKEALTKAQRELGKVSIEDGGEKVNLLESIQSLLAQVDAIGSSHKGSEKQDSIPEMANIDEAIKAIKEQLPDEEIAQEKSKAFQSLRAFMKDRKTLLDTKEQLEEKVLQLVHVVHADPSLRENTVVWGVVQDVESRMEGIEDKIEELAQKNPVAFQAHWLLRMREWKDSYEKYGIIETPAIEQQARDIMNDARRKLEGTNGVVALLGPTGSGKTVLAKKIAQQFSSDGTYEFVSAHPKMTAFDLISRMGIVVEQLDPTEIPQKIAEAQEAYKAENSETTGADLETALASIKDVIEGRAKEKAFETKPILEAVGRAQRDGKIVVIDEFNYLPPETLAALNEILSSKDNPPGFGVVFTGNVGEEYLKRQGLDPALINRIMSGTVKYEFPPQEINKVLDTSIVSAQERAEGNKTPERDLYQIATVHLLDKKGNLLAPENALQKVWDFTRVVALTQQLASGKDFRGLGMNAPPGVSKFNFKSVFLSFRNMNQVVREWKLDGFSKPIESYIFETIIRPANVYAPKEAAQLMYLFKDWGGFFQDETWNGVTLDKTQWLSGGIEQVKSQKAKKQTLKAFQPAEVVEAISGQKLPEARVDEEQVKASEQAREFEVEIANSTREIQEMKKLFESPGLSILEKICNIRFTEKHETQPKTIEA